MAILQIRWQGILDVVTCPTCKDLIKSKSQWNFDNSETPFPHILAHPVWGVVWDCDTDRPTTHGGLERHCRCELNWTMNDVDLQQKLQEIKERVKVVAMELLSQTEVWSGVGEVSVVRARSGRFVSWSKNG